MRFSALGAAPFRLDRLSAESVLNGVAIIEAHLATVRVVMNIWPEEAAAAGLHADVALYKDQFARLEAEYRRVRRTAAEVFTDGRPREIAVEDFEMLKVLDDVTASLAFKAEDAVAAMGYPRDYARQMPAVAAEVAAAHAGAAVLATWQKAAVGGAAAAALVGIGLLVL